MVVTEFVPAARITVSMPGLMLPPATTVVKVIAFVPSALIVVKPAYCAAVIDTAAMLSIWSTTAPVAAPSLMPEMLVPVVVMPSVSLPPPETMVVPVRSVRSPVLKRSSLAEPVTSCPAAPMVKMLPAAIAST